MVRALGRPLEPIFVPERGVYASGIEPAFRVQALGLGLRVYGVWFRVERLEFMVYGLWFMVYGLGFRV